MKIKTYLEKIKELVKQDKKAEKFYSFVIENGKEFKNSKIKDKRILKWIKIRKPKKKNCFYNSQFLALDVKGLKYYEGWAIGSVGIPLEHSWCVDEKNQVVEVTWEKGMEYFGLEIPLDFVRKEMIKTGWSNGLLEKYYSEKIF